MLQLTSLCIQRGDSTTPLMLAAALGDAGTVQVTHYAFPVSIVLTVIVSRLCSMVVQIWAYRMRMAMWH